MDGVFALRPLDLQLNMPRPLHQPLHCLPKRQRLRQFRECCSVLDCGFQHREEAVLGEVCQVGRSDIWLRGLELILHPRLAVH